MHTAQASSIAADDPLQDFGIDSIGQLGEADHVAEQHRELAALPFECVLRRGISRQSAWGCRESGERGGEIVSPVRRASIALRIVLRGPRGSPSSFKSPSLSSGKLAGVNSSRSNASAKRSSPRPVSHCRMSPIGSFPSNPIVPLAQPSPSGLVAVDRARAASLLVRIHGNGRSSGSRSVPRALPAFGVVCRRRDRR